MFYLFNASGELNVPNYTQDHRLIFLYGFKFMKQQHLVGKKEDILYVHFNFKLGNT